MKPVLCFIELIPASSGSAYHKIYSDGERSMHHLLQIFLKINKKSKPFQNSTVWGNKNFLLTYFYYLNDRALTKPLAECYLYLFAMPTTASYDERAMLAMVASGNRVAFTKLYSTHLPHLYRYIFLIVKSKEETEEILQEIFIKVWENREKLEGIESLKDYLFRMAKNKLLDNVRHLQIRHKVLAEIKRTKDAAAATTSDQCAYREYYQIVQQAMDKLPPKRKLIFRLNIENGLSQDEIAAQLNISKSVVKKQLYSASHFVREYLGEHSEISIPVMLAVFLHTI